MTETKLETEIQPLTLEQEFTMLAQAHVDVSETQVETHELPDTSIEIASVEYANSDAASTISRLVFKKLLQPFHSGYAVIIHDDELAQEEGYIPEEFEVRDDPIGDRTDCFFRRIQGGYLRVEQLDQVQDFMDRIMDLVETDSLERLSPNQP